MVDDNAASRRADSSRAGLDRIVPYVAAYFAAVRELGCATGPIPGWSAHGSLGETAKLRLRRRGRARANCDPCWALSRFPWSSVRSRLPVPSGLHRAAGPLYRVAQIFFYETFKIEAIERMFTGGEVDASEHVLLANDCSKGTESRSFSHQLRPHECDEPTHYFRAWMASGGHSPKPLRLAPIFEG